MANTNRSVILDHPVFSTSNKMKKTLKIRTTSTVRILKHRSVMKIFGANKLSHSCLAVPTPSKDKQEFSKIQRQDDVIPILSPTKDLLVIPPMDEAHNDFYGLPSNPISIYHTGPAWPLPSQQARRIPKEARPVCDHEIAPVWCQLSEKLYKYFDSIKLKWTSIDPVRFADAGKEPGPLFLWVGVMPKTLSRDDAKVAALRCKEILTEYGIINIEIAFCESIFTRSAGPRLLDHVPTIDPTANVRSPFTPTLGLKIALKTFPYFKGTGGLYLREGGESNQLFLLTARHIVLPPSKCPNTHYYRKNSSTPRREVIHLGSKAYQTTLEVITCKIAHEATAIDSYKNEITALGKASEGKDTITTGVKNAFGVELAKAEVSKSSMVEFYSNITRFWSAEGQRILGHVLYAPPISIQVGDKQFTEDWALVELNHEKFDWDAFQGNVIDIATFQYIGPHRSIERKLSKLTPGEFMAKMYPHAETRAKFKYPLGGLIRLRDFVKDGELRKPTMLDANGEECLIVVKNGNTTGVTVGRMSSIESRVRVYEEYDIDSTSMEIAIYPYSHEDGAFSDLGDSGSIISDANSRIVGMLTGGSGATESTDVTYASPYYFLDERIKKAFPNSHLYPFLA